MNRSLVKEQPAMTRRSSASGGEMAHVLFFVMFLAAVAIVGINASVASGPFGTSQFPEAALLVLAVVTTMTGVARQLPGQNVVLAAVVILIIGGAAQTLGALTAIPFGPFVYGERMGPQLFHPLPWAAPLIWVVAILNSRGVARLMMRPWRKMRSYGFWVIGITGVLVAIFDLGLEPFATRVQHYWVWNPTKMAIDYYGTPYVNFVAWAAVALLILGFVTPSLINKKPGKSPPSFHPLILWLLLQLLFMVAAASHQLWGAAATSLVASIVVAFFAVRGGTW